MRVDEVFKQRRFVSPEEQSRVLDTLSGVPESIASGLETDGWFYAQLYLSDSGPTIERP